MTRPEPREFRKRLLSREPLLGTFMKSPGSHNTEILASAGFDFLVLDQEHAPWERHTLDSALLAARAFGTAGFVRIARADAANIVSVLDDGAIGLLSPHVDSGDKARKIVAWSRYIGGERGAAIGRGLDYGSLGKDGQKIADDTTTVIAMIEDYSALAELDDIVSTPGIDAIFIGRADLALSLRNAGKSPPDVADAVEAIAAACKRHDKVLAAVVPSLKSEDAEWLVSLGATALMVGSDHGFLKQAGGKALDEFREVMGIPG